LAAVPRSGLSRFRADARLTLPAEQFAALDAHYQHGIHAAERYLSLRAKLERFDPPVNPGRARPLPLHYRDPIGLQGFLCELAGTAARPAAALARIRGAQAGMFAGGISLQVPTDLASARGPGLSGVCVDADLVAAIRRGIANPHLAALLALAALTGLSAQELTVSSVTRADRPGFEFYGVRTRSLSLPAAYYRLPDPARPLLAAATSFLEHTRDPHRDLTKGVGARLLDNAASAAGITLPAVAGPVRPVTPWHAQATAWYHGEALHRTDARAVRTSHAIAL
jgi:hypothetical protein